MKDKLRELGFEPLMNNEVVVSGSNELNVFEMSKKLLELKKYLIHELEANNVIIHPIYRDVGSDCMKTKIIVEWS